MPKARKRATARKDQDADSRRTKRSSDRSDDGKGLSSPKELFEHELKDIYTGETLLLEALEELESESTDPDLAEAFAKHREETDGHIQRLEEVAEALDVKIEAERCPGIEGLIAEKKLFAKEKPSSDILNIYNVGAGQKSERYEITHYEGMIELAGMLGYTDAVSKLKENLAEEEAALKTLKKLGTRLSVPLRV